MFPIPTTQTISVSTHRMSDRLASQRTLVVCQVRRKASVDSLQKELRVVVTGSIEHPMCEVERLLRKALHARFGVCLGENGVIRQSMVRDPQSRGYTPSRAAVAIAFLAYLSLTACAGCSCSTSTAVAARLRRSSPWLRRRSGLLYSTNSTRWSVDKASQTKRVTGKGRLLYSTVAKQVRERARKACSSRYVYMVQRTDQLNAQNTMDKSARLCRSLAYQDPPSSTPGAYGRVRASEAS